LQSLKLFKYNLKINDYNSLKIVGIHARVAQLDRDPFLPAHHQIIFCLENLNQ
jgi:hypothetical protein